MTSSAKNIFILSAAFLFLAAPFFVDAATLTVVPSTGSVSVGSTVTLSVMLDSQGTAINTAEGILSYPPDLFSVVSINKDTSIFPLWIQAPASDGSGSISFNGGLPSPGYAGSNGRVLTVTLRALAPGSASFTLGAAAVRANDGLGTDVLKSVTRATVLSTAASAPAPKTQVEQPVHTAPPVKESPNKIIITSPTHPSSDVWYSTATAIVAWENPTNVTAVQTGVDTKKEVVPAVTHQPAINTLALSNLDEGVNYFGVRARTSDGWSPVSTYEIKIDRTLPGLTDAVITYHPDTSMVSVQGIATDALSGIAKFVVLIDGKDIADIGPDQLNGKTYSVPVDLLPGSHSATLRAVDHAGNVTDALQPVFEVTPPLNPWDIFVGWIYSLDLITILLTMTVLLSGFSVYMNTVLWRKLNQYAHYIEHMHERRGISPEDAQYLKKMRNQLTEAEAFIDKKIKSTEQ